MFMFTTMQWRDNNDLDIVHLQIQLDERHRNLTHKLYESYDRYEAADEPCIDKRFVEALLEFRRWSRNNNWRIYFSFIKLVIAYVIKTQRGGT